MTEQENGGGLPTVGSDDDDFDLDDPKTMRDVITAMGVWNCFSDLEPIEDQGLHNGLDSRMEDLLEHFIENPCCGNRSPSHVIKAFARLCITLGFQAGARSQNLNVEGLQREPARLPTEEDVRAAQQEEQRQEEEERAEAKTIVSSVIEKMGLETVEHEGVVGVVVKSREQLEELLTNIRTGQFGEDGEGHKTGMYL
jgi:hypothetical protein